MPQSCAENTDAESKCPCCHTSNPVVVPNKVEKGKTMDLKVKCNRGCNWTGELIDFSKHINEICPSRVAKCPYD